MKRFNGQYHAEMCRHLDIEMPPLDSEAFLDFAFPGQPSVPHLAEFIHARVLKAIKKRVEELHDIFHQEDEARQKEIRTLIDRMDRFSVKQILDTWLDPEIHPDIFQSSAATDDPDIPERLKLTHTVFLNTIGQLLCDFRITLKLDHLTPEDVLEILYDSKGLVTRLEIINLKNFVSGKTDHLFAVNELQKAINSGSLLKLKHQIRESISRVEQREDDSRLDRLNKLYQILYDIDALKSMYAAYPLKSRIGSDSTGKSHQAYGMGFCIVNTLPFRAQKTVRHQKKDRLILPANIRVSQQMTAVSTDVMHPFFQWLLAMLQWLPGLDQIQFVKMRRWVFESFSLDMKKKGNVVTLGGIQKQATNGLLPEEHLSASKKMSLLRGWKNLNTRLKNGLKISLGFIPAFVCFFSRKTGGFWPGSERSSGSASPD